MTAANLTIALDHSLGELSARLREYAATLGYALWSESSDIPPDVRVTADLSHVADNSAVVIHLCDKPPQQLARHEISSAVTLREFHLIIESLLERNRSGDNDLQQVARLLQQLDSPACLCRDGEILTANDRYTRDIQLPTCPQGQHWDRHNERFYDWQLMHCGYTPTHNSLHLAIAQDISDGHSQIESAAHESSLNTLVLGISAALFAADIDSVDDQIQQTIAEIGEYCDVDRAYVFSVDKQHDLMINTFEWCNNGIAPFIDQLQNLPLSDYAHWNCILADGTNIVFNDVPELGEEWAAERELLTMQGVRSLICVPIINSDGLIGFLGFDSVQRFRHWSQNEARTLRLVADMLAGAIYRRDAFLQLQNTEFRLKYFLQGSGQGIWEWSPDTQNIEVSREWLTLRGYPEGERYWTISRILAQIHPDDREAAKLAMERYLIGDAEEFHHEYRTLHRQGHYIWVENRAFIMARNDDGSPSRLIGANSDITQKRLARQQLQLSNRQLDAMFENSQVGIALLDGEHRITRCNNRLAEILLLKNPQDAQYSAFEDWLLTEDDLHRFKDQCSSLQVKSRSRNARYQLRRKDGSRVWCELSGKRIENEAETTDLEQHAVWVINDITHIKIAEYLLEEENALFSGGPAMVFRWSADTNWPVLFCSPNTRAILGYSPHDLVSGDIRFAELIHPEDLPAVRKEVQDYLEQRRTHWNQEYRLQRIDGSYIHCFDFTRAHYSKDGALEALHGYVLDITRQKIAEESRLQMERELQHAHRMEAVGQLTGGIAHEFNNMLAVMLGHLSLMQMKMPKDQQQQFRPYFDRIEGAGKRSTELISQMLTFSRPAERNPQRLQLSAAMTEILKSARATLPTSISLEYTAAPNLPDIEFDEGELQQVVMNLLINARDATNGRGEISIRLAQLKHANQHCTACNAPLNGHYVLLQICDNGEGIASDNIERIFEPFYSTKEVGKGTGLGLAVVHNILQHANAHLTVSSILGQGSYFTLYFPLPTRPCAIAFGQSRQDNSPTTHQLSGRVLVVDDEPAITEYLQELLSSWSLQVSAFTSSMEALDAFRQTPAEFDFVISDQTMPELTGSELIYQIHKLRKDIPALLCSGDQENFNAEISRQLGIELYMPKPLSSNALLQLLSKKLPPKYSLAENHRPDSPTE